MNIYVLDSIEKVSFFRDSNQIVARVNSILYQVVAESQLHQLLMNYQLTDERIGTDSNFIVTTNEH
ncbi:MAG: hypothetical protein ACRC9R_01530, partial [Enterovibrio sp.]